MQHTENYKLNLIETSDTFSPEALNENAKTLDAVATQIVTGVYEGDGASSRDFELGFKPKAVLLFRNDGMTYSGYYPYGGLALPGSPVYSNTSYMALKITDTGFSLSSGSYAFTNVLGARYHYIVFR